MSDAGADNRRGLQGDLDREQAVIDLDQGIADREQARADRAQEPLDATQKAFADGAPEARGATRSDAERTTEIGLNQDRQDAHQAQIDQTQLAQGIRQDVLDQQQVSIESPSADAADDDLARFGEELHEALRQRAEDTLTRAESQRLRASETLRRLDAAKLRRKNHP